MRLNLDAEDDNANWTKKTWDLPATNLEELRGLLDEIGIPVADFKMKLVYRANMGRMPWLKYL